MTAFQTWYSQEPSSVSCEVCVLGAVPVLYLRASYYSAALKTAHERCSFHKLICIYTLNAEGGSLCQMYDMHISICSMKAMRV